MPDDRPNILLLFSDQHSARWCGYAGHPVVRTPNLDALAESGTAFDSAYCNAPICVPSRMSFLTGRHVSEIGIWDNHVILPPETPTFAHALRRAGYDVVLNGKMHFRGEDKLHGFRAQLSDDPAGRSVGSFPIPRWREGGRVPGTPGVWQPKLKEGRGKGVDFQAEEAAIEYLRDPDRAQNPWAMVVGLYAPHPPWTVPREFLDLYRESDTPLPDMPPDHLVNQHPVHRRKRRLQGHGDEQLPSDLIRRTRHTYFALVSRVDWQVGNIIRALEASGQRENTVIIYSSDHGEMLGEHGLWNKSSLYDEALRVPLILSCPERIPAGHRVRECVSLVDLTETLLDLGAARDHLETSGDSLLPLARGEDPLWKDEAFAEHYATWTDRPIAMLRKGRWKYHASHREAPQLYDMEADPGEFHDLGDSAEHAALREHLAGRLARRWDAEALNETILASQDARIADQENGDTEPQTKAVNFPESPLPHDPGR